MSEYQSYEFVALDRPLTAAQKARFWNEYNWSDLEADPGKLVRALL